ncbi:Tol-Pal system beta propeller repeat protein TolB [Stakelama sediminis]|uniref:Tol-Pal system protein TolB n=2 Tax=Stakelama sediminis TaxID=463200 RepID=A0A840YV08_9SPHN|nr:Tol-Pal system beta propeller repeat protein TolB [Stakelama sediminis]MBB5717473.1 TolB protein [Stakelama sediminis]
MPTRLWTRIARLILAPLALLLFHQAAFAQVEVNVVGGASAPTPIAVPAMPTDTPVNTAAGPTDQLGRQLAQVISDDLKNSGLFRPLSPDVLRPVSFQQVSAPTFDYWSTTGAQALVQGFVKANSDGTLTVGCYLYDVFAQNELQRQGFVVSPGEWRRAAHKCADMVYTRMTGDGPYFDSRIVYVSETGPKTHRIKRLAIMDQDGANHRFLTNGQSIVLTPRFAPNQQTIVYMSYANKQPSIHVYNLGSGHSRELVSGRHLTFGPVVSPDGRWVLFSMAIGGNTDLYRIPIGGGTPQRLTNSPGIDTGGSYSPDGSRIAFESDRSGTQQVYIMNADGSNQHRISFGSGRYGTPAWSPRGDLIAYTHIGANFRIGVMKPDGSGQRLLTDSWQDEGPSWAPNGRVIVFQRTPRGSGLPQIWTVDLTGQYEHHIPTPLGGSDPDWGPLRK